MILEMIALGDAPTALLSPISLVLSFTDITIIFITPMEPDTIAKKPMKMVNNCMLFSMVNTFSVLFNLL